MSPLLALFLFLHVMGAIVVFGPTFAFPIIASQAQKSPQNGAFAAALSDLIERRIVIPGAIVQGITGLALILILGVNPLTDAAYLLGYSDLSAFSRAFRRWTGQSAREFRRQHAQRPTIKS